jgi:hypothetical protein
MPSSFHTACRRSPCMSAARLRANRRPEVPESPARSASRSSANYRQNFDPAFTSTAKIDYAIGIPLTHLGHSGRYCRSTSRLPAPQPTMERRYQFGQAVRAPSRHWPKIVILSSGGMSLPGTDRYSNRTVGTRRCWRSSRPAT